MTVHEASIHIKRTIPRFRIACSGVRLWAWTAEKPYFKRFSGIEKVHRNSIKITVDLWRRGWDSNPRDLSVYSISSQVAKTEPGGIWWKITANTRTLKMPCFQGFPHLFASKTPWKSESESLLRFHRVLTDFRESLLEFLIEPIDFSLRNHAFGSAWKAPVMPNCTKSHVGKCRGEIKTAVIGKNISENGF